MKYTDPNYHILSLYFWFRKYNYGKPMKPNEAWKQSIELNNRRINYGNYLKWI